MPNGVTKNYSFKKRQLGHSVRDVDIAENLDLIDTELKVRADYIDLGDATHEGGDISIYRDASGNKQLSLDADAASNALALSVYGGVVVQNYLSVGVTSLNTAFDLYVSGTSYFSGNVFTTGDVHLQNGKGLQSRVDNITSLIAGNIIVTGTDSTDHAIKIRIDSSDIIVAQATGDGAGGITNKAIGLYGTTPTTQATAISDPAESIAANNAAIDSILAALRAIGLIAT